MTESFIAASPTESTPVEYPMSFPQFNPALGTLVEVELTYSFAINPVARVTGNGVVTQFQMVLPVSIIGPQAYGSSQFGFVSYGPPGNGTLTISGNGSFTDPGSPVVSATPVPVSAEDFSYFEGSGYVTAMLESRPAQFTESFTGSPVFGDKSTASGSLTIQYTYDFSVPEPAAMGFLSLLTSAVVRRPQRRN